MIAMIMMIYFIKINIQRIIKKSKDHKCHLHIFMIKLIKFLKKNYKKREWDNKKIFQPF